MPDFQTTSVKAFPLRSFWKWATGAAVIYISLVCAVWPLSWLVQNYFRENYEWRAAHALHRGNPALAEQVIRDQTAVEDYDFFAHHLLAETLLKADNSEKAIEVLNISMERERAVSGRNVFNRGMNPYESRSLLSKALKMAGKSREALLMENEANKRRDLSGAGIVAEGK